MDDIERRDPTPLQDMSDREILEELLLLGRRLAATLEQYGEALSNNPMLQMFVGRD